jgi:hypothetical protein
MLVYGHLGTGILKGEKELALRAEVRDIRKGDREVKHNKE